MPLRPALRETSSAGSDAINLTPLLDVLFLILFFFLLATEAKRDIPAVELDLPDLGHIAETREALPDSTLLITITREGGLHVNVDPVAPDELDARLAALDRATIDTVLIRVDTAAESGLLVRAMHAASTAGFPTTLVERATGESP